MKYIINKSNDTAFNIALEEYCFKQLNADEIFILWINKPSIIIGKHQNAIEEINAQYVKEHDITVARRISGGGAVYHDLQNLNYTIISSHSVEAFDFKRFSIPVIKTLEKLGVTATFSGRNDIMINEKKICGNAQAYHNNRIMHHGCLLFDVDLTVLEKALKVSADKIESKGIKSVRSRVTNIKDELPKKITIDEFKYLILDEMKSMYSNFSEYMMTDDDVKAIEKLRDEKHANWDWVYGKSPNYNIKREAKFLTGKVTALIDVENSYIKDMNIYGDFFGIKDIKDITDALKGVKYTKEEVFNVLTAFEINDYFMGINHEGLVNTLCVI